MNILCLEMRRDERERELERQVLGLASSAVTILVLLLLLLFSPRSACFKIGNVWIILEISS